MDQFVEWYNHEHRHSGIGLHTPADVHYGLAADKAVECAAVLAAARAHNPHRFSTTGVVPKILQLPEAAWIKQSVEQASTDQESTTTAA